MTATHNETPRLCVMLSSSGRTLLNLLDHIRTGKLRATVPLVIASRQCPGVDHARAAGVSSVRIIEGEIPAETLHTILREHQIDLVVLAGYLKLVHLPAPYRQRVLNIHPSLLPKFGGSGMHGRRVHEAVLLARETESGCTVHYCDDRFDTGEIILQERCRVLDTDTPDTLAARVFDCECRAYPRAISRVLETAR